MIDQTRAEQTSSTASRSDWVQAGTGWGARATQWAYLFEPYALPANRLLFDQLGLGEGTAYLDIACGSGLAASVAAYRGASVSGLDASTNLIDIARVRTPGGDFRVGDMFDLPFEDKHFDVVTSFNGIWNGCDDALSESHRVLTTGGQLGMTFWGPFDRMGLLPYFAKIIELSPPSHRSSTIEMGETGQAVQAMLQRTGFDVERYGTVEVTNEWPDADTAVRALASAGPAIPAIEAVGYDAFCEALHEFVAPLHNPQTGVRISSDLVWVTARPS